MQDVRILLRSPATSVVHAPAGTERASGCTSALRFLVARGDGLCFRVVAWTPTSSVQLWATDQIPNLITANRSAKPQTGQAPNQSRSCQALSRPGTYLAHLESPIHLVLAGFAVTQSRTVEQEPPRHGTPSYSVCANSRSRCHTIPLLPDLGCLVTCGKPNRHRVLYCSRHARARSHSDARTSKVAHARMRHGSCMCGGRAAAGPAPT